MAEKYTGISLKELFKKEQEDRLLLPNFQRDFVWSRKDQLTLLASFLIDIPIGSLLLVKDDKGKYATRKLCYNVNSKPGQGECQYVLDGQQRLSTLKSIFYDFYKDANWENTLDDIYHPLRTRWFLKVRQDKEELDWLGWKELNFKKDQFIVDPQDIFDFIDYEIIHKNQVEKWFHPGHYKFILENELNDEERKYIEEKPEFEENLVTSKIAAKASEEGLIPLFDILSDPKNTLLKKVLEKIAEKRIESIEVMYKEDVDKLQEIFIDQSELWKYLNDYDENIQEIKSGWLKLRGDWVNGVINYLSGVIDQEIAVIQLGSEEISRAIPVFEYMNKQGTTLNVFDLIVARAAFSDDGTNHDTSLREDVNEIFSESLNIKDSAIDEIHIPDEWNPSSFGIFDKDGINYSTQQIFLNLLSLNSNLSLTKKSFRKLKVDDFKTKSCLNLSSDQINNSYENTLKGIKRAFAFSQFKLGHISIGDVSYRLMLVPLCFFLKYDDVWNDSLKLKKLEYWWWTTIFSDAFRDDKQDQLRKDLKSLYKWVIEGSSNPYVENRFSRILSVENWNDKSALLLESSDNNLHNSIQTGLLTYVLSNRPIDLLPKKKFEEYRLKAWELDGNHHITEIGDDERRPIYPNKHHIIPLGEIKELGEKTKDIRNDKNHILNSPLNLIYISDIANGIINDKSFDDYKKFMNDLSLSYHSIPKIDLKAEDSEKDVKGFLGKRFDQIKDDLKMYLKDLV